ncbi:MAG: transglutaminase domain-containing protein, partial [Desulfocapsaceae bacterium]|nr:transglutaminase domain-containing protein [Desulfocapsaceae bacterium]
MTGYRTVLFKGGVAIAWLLSFFLLLQRDYFIEPLDAQEALALARDAATEFQGIYFKNSKIGYVQTQYQPGDDSLRIEQQAVMHLTISGETQPIDLNLSAVVAADNTLQSFDFNFSSLFYQMKAEGVVENNRVLFTLDTGNSTISDHLDLKAAPMLSTSRRRYLLRDELREGDKISVPWFDPVSLSAKNSTIEYRGKEQILIHGRVFHLHRFTEYFSGARINSWLDDDGTVVKEESPAGFVFIQEP